MAVAREAAGRELRTACAACAAMDSSAVAISCVPCLGSDSSEEETALSAPVGSSSCLK